MELLRMASSMRMESNQSDNDYGDKWRWENTYTWEKSLKRQKLSHSNNLTHRKIVKAAKIEPQK